VQFFNDEVLPGVVHLYMPTVHRDERGVYTETWNKNLYEQATRAAWDERFPHPSLYRLLFPKIEWVQDDVSISGRNVLRGIHGDDRTWKLISCLAGCFYLVVVNNRPRDENRYKWTSAYLTGADGHQVLIPPNFGNGHLIMGESAIFQYKQSTYYEGAEHQFTIRWNDPAVGIQWPLWGDTPILSERDREAADVEGIPSL